MLLFAKFNHSFFRSIQSVLQNMLILKIFYERGMVQFHRGDFFSSLSDMKDFMALASAEDLKNLATSSFYLQEGISYAELGLYDKAVKALTESIAIDPDNKEAYFERAAGHFELGNFDLAIQDHISSGLKPTLIDLDDHITFESVCSLSSGISKGLSEVIQDIPQAIKDFPNALLSSLHGLSHALWAIADHPNEVSKEIVDSCQALVEVLSDPSVSGFFEAIAPELKQLHHDEITAKEKTEILGYCLGKYGIEIFGPAKLFKVAKAYKELRAANRIFTLEHLSKHTKSAVAIEETAVKWNKAHQESIEKFKLAKETLKPFKGQFLTETQARKILHQAGFETFPRPKGIPENFIIKLTDKPGGLHYSDPKNPHILVRVMPGKPHSPNVYQQQPYVVQMRGGKAVDQFGNMVESEAVEAHIPLNAFIYQEGL